MSCLIKLFYNLLLISKYANEYQPSYIRRLGFIEFDQTKTSSVYIIIIIHYVIY